MKKKLMALGGVILASAPFAFARQAPAAVFAAFEGNCKMGASGEWVCSNPNTAVSFLKSGDGISMLVIFIFIGIAIYLYSKKKK